MRLETKCNSSSLTNKTWREAAGEKPGRQTSMALCMSDSGSSIHARSSRGPCIQASRQSSTAGCCSKQWQRYGHAPLAVQLGQDGSTRVAQQSLLESLGKQGQLKRALIPAARGQGEKGRKVTRQLAFLCSQALTRQLPCQSRWHVLLTPCLLLLPAWLMPRCAVGWAARPQRHGMQSPGKPSPGKASPYLSDVL